jgi:ubiquinone/menaquinone biosynthesis C-methylase UbiE
MKLDQMDRLYTSNNPFVKHVHLKRINIIRSLAGVDHGKLLDCGCGEGHMLSMFEGSKFGVDISDVELARASQRNPTATLVKASLTSMPFEDGSFDTAICSEVLEHIEDYRAAASEIVRVTKSGGKIIISVPNERNWTIGRLIMLRLPPKLDEHINDFRYGDIPEIIGFEPASITYVPVNAGFNLALTQIFEFRKP